MKNIKLILILVILFFSHLNLNAKINIKYKIGDEIITNIDVLNEKKYLIFLRPNLKSLSNSEVIEIAEKSLIKEIIKKKEIDRIFKENNNPNIDKEIKKKLFDFKNTKNEEEFIKLTKKNKIDYNKIIEKVKYESLWNELIFQKYNSLIRIDEKRLKEDLVEKISNNRKFEYNLSEILFEIENKENLKKKYNEIIEFIEKNNFKIAASKYSISNSSNKGGQIGWVKETLLSKELILLLEKMKKNQVSEPLKFPNGYLILRINEKKEMKQNITFEKEYEELIMFEKNKQLNQFSLLFYKKLKQNSQIYEY